MQLVDVRVVDGMVSCWTQFALVNTLLTRVVSGHG